jgi:hypothetical protein
MLILAMLIFPRLSTAQQKTKKAGAVIASKDATDQSDWRVKSTVRLEEWFDNNPFLLSDMGQAALAALSASSLQSGRFATMLDASDWITALHGSIAAEGAGLFDRRLALEADARYDYYHRNVSRRNVDFNVSAMQALGHGAHLGVRAHVLPSFYFRNFMSDAVDANGDGIIQPNERIYAAGTYADNDLAVEYRQRLVRSTPDQPFGARLVLVGGHRSRKYQAPFEMRSYRGPHASALVALDLMSGLTMDLGYRRASLASTPGTAVLLLNEPDFNQDFNGNGTRTDLSVRSVQMVDFSRVEQTFTTRVRAHLSDNVETELAFGRRYRTFGSNQPYDVYNNTRRDSRDRTGMHVSFRVSPQVRLKVGALGESEKVSNTLRAVPLDGVTVYTRKTFMLSLAYHL